MSPRSAGGLLAELHAGRFHAAHGLFDGDLQRFTETSMGEAPEAPG